MHEIMNGLNPRGDARLLEALGLTRQGGRNADQSANEPSRQSEIVIRRCARLVAGQVHAHSAHDPGERAPRARRETTTTRRE